MTHPPRPRARPAATAGLAALAAGFGLFAGAGAAAASEKVPFEDMAKYCIGMASSEFGGRPPSYSALPAERNNGGYTVYGQTPPTNSQALFFECAFGGDGRFRKVVATRDARVDGAPKAAAGGHDKRTVVAVGDMSAYCIGEASSAFHVKPTYIDAKSPKKGDSGRHEVKGDYRGDKDKKVKFTCRFGPNDGFVDVTRD